MRSPTSTTASPRYVKTALTPSLSLLILVSKKVIRTEVVKEKNNTVLEEFKNYFLGKGDIDIPLDHLDISPDNRCYRVYLFLKEKVVFGNVITYGELGRTLGVHPRFVAFCMKINPFPVIIPCHRVLSKKGLGGYSAGVDIKRELLRHEGHRIVF
ncbi:methylated-DNA--[protein]-cysteine S-methyltransferase [Aquifex pyrophilus]